MKNSAMTTRIRGPCRPELAAERRRRLPGIIVNRERIIIRHPRVPRRPLTYAWNRPKIAPRDANRPEITALVQRLPCDALITINPTISSPTKIRQVYTRARARARACMHVFKVPRRYSCHRDSAQLLFARTREYAPIRAIYRSNPG